MEYKNLKYRYNLYIFKYLGTKYVQDLYTGNYKYY